MVDAYFTVGCMLLVMLVLGIVVPILDKSTKFGKFVSLRYTIVVFFLMLALGVLIDFSHLSDETRDLVIIGGFVLSLIFILCRSFEKIKLKGQTIQLKGEYKDAKAELSIKGADECSSTAQRHGSELNSGR